jgi:hypothetical protein
MYIHGKLFLGHWWFSHMYDDCKCVGGGWLVGHRSQHANPLLYQMAHAGWLVITISYRLSPVYRWPAHIIDCKLL